jgi:hypothetical protein
VLAVALLTSRLRRDDRVEGTERGGDGVVDA